MTAVFSPCRTWRYRLDRRVREGEGLHFGFAGINASTAAEDDEDQTSMKWRGFTVRNGGVRYSAVNPFALVSTDPKGLALAADPIGPDNDRHLDAVFAEVDVLVPCWGNLAKIPRGLRWRCQDVLQRMVQSGKPVRVFGFTASGDPKHPLMLSYNTPLVPWHPRESDSRRCSAR